MVGANIKSRSNKLWETTIRSIFVVGTLLGIGCFMVLFVIGLLNMLSFSYLGLMVGKLMFQSQEYILLTWLVFAVFTLYGARIWDKP